MRQKASLTVLLLTFSLTTMLGTVINGDVHGRVKRRCSRKHWRGGKGANYADKWREILIPLPISRLDDDDTFRSMPSYAEIGSGKARSEQLSPFLKSGTGKRSFLQKGKSTLECAGSESRLRICGAVEMRCSQA
jgi:hypothetical protein